MRNWIASFYLKKLRNDVDIDFWESLFVCYMDKKVFPKQKLKDFIQREFSNTSNDPINFYTSLKKLFSLIFYTRSFPYSYEDVLNPIFHKIMLKKFSCDFQPIFALQNLISYLLTFHFEKIIPEIHSDGMTFFSLNETFPHLQMPIEKYNLELSVYWKIFGVLQNDESLIQSANQIISWQLNWVDFQMRSIRTLWSCPKCTNEENNLLLSFLTNQKLPLDLPKKTPFFLIAILLLQDEILSNFSKLNIYLKQDVRNFDLATLHYRNEDLQLIFTLRGANSGLGFAALKDFSILSFGPHKYPIENPCDFGIFRTYCLKNQKFDNVAKTNNSLLGWTRLCLENPESLYPIKPSLKWMQLHAFIISNKKWGLSIKFVGLKNEEEIGFCFFVKANACCINDSKILSTDSKKICINANQIFFNTPSQKVIFQNYVSKNIIVDSQKKYWDEDFFVTYLVKGDEPTLNMEIEISN